MHKNSTAYVLFACVTIWALPMFGGEYVTYKDPNTGVRYFGDAIPDNLPKNVKVEAKKLEKVPQLGGSINIEKNQNNKIERENIFISVKDKDLYESGVKRAKKEKLEQKKAEMMRDLEGWRRKQENIEAAASPQMFYGTKYNSDYFQDRKTLENIQQRTWDYYNKRKKEIESMDIE